MCQGKNQTSEKSLKSMVDINATRTNLGTGIFMVPAPEIGVLEYRVINVPNLTYEECYKRGANCTIFKWVSHAEGSLEEVVSSQARCSGFCQFAGGWCPIGCICPDWSNFCR